MNKKLMFILPLIFFICGCQNKQKSTTYFFGDDARDTLALNINKVVQKENTLTGFGIGEVSYRTSFDDESLSIFNNHERYSINFNIYNEGYSVTNISYYNLLEEVISQKIFTKGFYNNNYYIVEEEVKEKEKILNSYNKISSSLLTSELIYKLNTTPYIELGNHPESYYGMGYAAINKEAIFKPLNVFFVDFEDIDSINRNVTTSILDIKDGLFDFTSSESMNFRVYLDNKIFDISGIFAINAKLTINDEFLSMFEMSVDFQGKSNNKNAIFKRFSFSGLQSKNRNPLPNDIFDFSTLK